MNSKVFTFLLLIFATIFNTSCSSGDEVEPTSNNSSSQNPAQNSSRILKFIKSAYSNPTHYFQSSNGKIILWNTSYNVSYNAVIHSVSYNSMGKIDKISISNSSTNNEAQFKYNNNLLSEIVYLHEDINGNFLPHKSYTVQYINSKIYRLIRTNYNTPQDYINDSLNNCNITELEFSGENVTKASFVTGQYSRATGVINAESYAYFKRLYTYNNSVINPYSTFPIEFQVYLTQASLENSEYNADYFSKNAKNSITTHVNESLFSSYSFNYETDASLNGLPNKIDSNNGNFGSKATFEYDSY